MILFNGNSATSTVFYTNDSRWWFRLDSNSRRRVQSPPSSSARRPGSNNHTHLDPLKTHQTPQPNPKPPNHKEKHRGGHTSEPETTSPQRKQPENRSTPIRFQEKTQAIPRKTKANPHAHTTHRGEGGGVTHRNLIKPLTHERSPKITPLPSNSAQKRAPKQRIPTQ